jgi:hypothetical protein
MQKRKNIFVYIIFAVSVIYGLYFHLVENSGRKTTGMPVATDSVIEEIEPEAASIADMPIRADQLVAIPKGWGNPLFVPENNTRTTGNYSEGDEFGGLPRLSAISFYRGAKSFAIINNKVVQAGEKVDGWQVVSIASEHVFVKNRFGTNKLSLGEKL